MFNSREKLFIGLISFVHFCLIVDFMLLMPLGAKIMSELAIGAKEFAKLIGVHTFVSGLSGIAAAIFLDLYERKKVLIYSMLGFIFSAIIAYFANDYMVLMGARFLSGVFVGILGTLILIIISDVIPIEKRGTALGIVMAAFALAAIVGVPSALFMANKLGWNSSFLFLIFVNILCILTIWFKMPKLTDHFNQERTIKKSIAGLKNLVQDKNRIFALLFLTTLILGHFSVIPFLFPSIVSNSKIPQTSLPLIYLCGGIVSIIASIIFGLLCDKWHLKKTFTIAMLGSIPTLFFITRMGEIGLPMIIFAISCFYTFMGGRMTPAMTLITSTTSIEDRGNFMGITSAVNHLAAGLAAFIAGQIVVKQDDGVLLYFDRVGVFAIVFSLIAFAIIWKVKTLKED